MKDKLDFRAPWLRWLLISLAATALLVGSFWFDAVIEQWVVAHQTKAGTYFMRWVSILGDWEGHVLVALAGMAVAYFKGNKTWVRICLALIIACAVGGAAARVGKIALGRARPSAHESHHWSGPKLTSKFHSFPSGHATASVAFFTTLLLARRKIAAPLLFIPAVIGCSRIYLLAHYFSDVIGGVVIGAACGVLVAYTFLRKELAAIP